MLNSQKFNAVTILTYGLSECNRFPLIVILLQFIIQLSIALKVGKSKCNSLNKSSVFLSFFLSTRQHHFWFLFWLVRLLEASPCFAVASSWLRRAIGNRWEFSLFFLLRYSRPTNRWVLRAQLEWKVRETNCELMSLSYRRSKCGRQLRTKRKNILVFKRIACLVLIACSSW